MALARKSIKKVADQCLFSRKSHNYALRNIGKTVLKEVKSFVAKSNLSLFGSHSMKDLREFEWGCLHQEILETHLLYPQFSSQVQSAEKNIAIELVSFVCAWPSSSNIDPIK